MVNKKETPQEASARLRKRVIKLENELNEESVTQTIAELLFLNREDPKAPIWVCIYPISAPIYLLKAIYDTIQEITAPVATIAFKSTSSYSTALLVGGEKGMRYASPDARIQLYRSVPLPAILREDLIAIYMQATGKDYETIERDIDRNLVMIPQQAIEYGLIDGFYHHYPKD